MCGNSHDSTGTVSHHYIIGDEYRYLLAAYRIDRADTVKTYTCLVLHKLCTLKLCLLGTFFTILCNLIKVCKPVFVFVDKRMLGSYYHKRHTKQRIASCRIYLELLIYILEFKINERTFALSDPVYFLLFDVFGKINRIKSFKKLVGVIGYAKIPYALFLLYNITVAYIALSSLGILIRKNDFTMRAVIDERVRTEKKSLFKKLKEYPLRPFIIIRITRCKISVPVKRESDSLELI